jgi:hypothetical protein
MKIDKLEEALEMIEKEVEKKEETKIEVSDKFGEINIESDIREDYSNTRTNLNENIRSTTAILQFLKDSMSDDLQMGMIKEFAMKARIYSELLRTYASINQDIMNLHTKFKELTKKTEIEEKDELMIQDDTDTTSNLINNSKKKKRLI